MNKQPTCKEHGPMLNEPAGTKEQEYCGEWWRCQLCTNTILIQSIDLQSQLKQRDLFQD